MYSLPSTSFKRGPHPSAKYNGTGNFARNGLLTPPASEPFARANIARDFCHLSNSVCSIPNALNDLFLHGIPVERAFLAVAIDGHTARNRHAEPEFHRTIRLLHRPASNAVHEILHVRVRRGLRLSD